MVYPITYKPNFLKGILCCTDYLFKHTKIPFRILSFIIKNLNILKSTVR